jgi:hypothetical protein
MDHLVSNTAAFAGSKRRADSAISAAEFPLGEAQAADHEEDDKTREDDDDSDDEDDDSDDEVVYVPKARNVPVTKPRPITTPAKKQTIKEIEIQIEGLRAEATKIRASRKPAQSKLGAIATPITVTVKGGLGSKAAKVGGVFVHTFVPAHTTIQQFKADCRKTFGKHALHSIGALIADPSMPKPLAIADLRDGMTIHMTYNYTPGNPQPMSVLSRGGGGFGGGGSFRRRQSGCPVQ